MKEKTKDLSGKIGQALASITEIGDLSEKKAISKKIKSLAKDLEKLITKKKVKAE